MHAEVSRSGQPARYMAAAWCTMSADAIGGVTKHPIPSASIARWTAVQRRSRSAREKSINSAPIRARARVRTAHPRTNHLNQRATFLGGVTILRSAPSGYALALASERLRTILGGEK